MFRISLSLRHGWIAVGLFLAAVAASAATGTGAFFDPNPNGNVYVALAQPDGKIVLGGSFTTVQPGLLGAPAQRLRLARFNPDGSVDASFAPALSDEVRALAIDREGRLIVGGRFHQVFENGVYYDRRGLARLNPDGSLDQTFDPQFAGQSASRAAVAAVAIQPDGRILVGGTFKQVTAPAGGTAVARPYLVRLEASGALDASFSPSPNNEVLAIAVGRDGGFAVGGAFTQLAPNGGAAVTALRLARFNADGSRDAGFAVGVDNLVRTLAVEVDDSLLVGGDFLKARGTGESALTTELFLARFAPDGVRDRYFHPRPNARVTALAVERAGSILVGGEFTILRPFAQSGFERPNLVRLNRFGSVDSDFRALPDAPVGVIVPQEDGSIILGGLFSSITDGNSAVIVPRQRAVRVQSDGTVEADFDSARGGEVYASAERADGTILIGGSFGSFAGATRFNLALITANGELVPSFNPVVNGSVRAIVVQADGKFIIGGNFTKIGDVVRRYLARFNADGSLDTAYDPQPNSGVYALLLETNGDLNLGGGFTYFTPNYDPDSEEDPVFDIRYYLARLNPDGTVDDDWRPGPSGTVTQIVRAPDGKYIVGGAFSSMGAELRNYVARLHVDGTVDKNWDPSPNAAVHAIAVEPDGDVLIGGEFLLVDLDDGEGDDDDLDELTDDDAIRIRLARIKADGSLDLGFVAQFNLPVAALHVLPDGDILVGGEFTSYTPTNIAESVSAAHFVRLNADGTHDAASSWHTTEAPLFFRPLSDGAVLVGGLFHSAFSFSQGSVRAVQYLLRYTAASEFDAGWGVRGTVSAERYVSALAVQRDGRMVVGGSFDALGGNDSANLMRFYTNGAADYTFPAETDGPVNALLNRVASGIWDSTRSSVAWLTANGLDRPGVDYGILGAVSGRILALKQETSGAVLIGGSFSNTAGTSGPNLARLLPNGTFDSSFRPGIDGTVNDIQVQPDGRILVGGFFTEVGGIERHYIVRLNPNGSVDTSFTAVPAGGSVYAIRLQPDGKILICGSFRTFDIDDGEADDDDGDEATDDDLDQPFLARLNADGSLDQGFRPKPNNFVGSMALHPNGDITFGGQFLGVTTVEEVNAYRARLARVTSDGLLVDDFDPRPNADVWDVVLQPDGKLLVSGAFTLFENLTDGEGDDDDGDGDTDTDGNARPDDDADVFYLGRINADGTLDTSFAPTPNATVREILLQTDGRLIVRGDFSGFFPNDAAEGISRNYVARVNANGTLDATFNPNPSDDVFSLAELADGSFMIGGDFTSLNAEAVLYLGGNFSSVSSVALPYFARVHPDGNPDASYLPEPDGPVYALAAQADRRILVGGAFSRLLGATRAGLARLDQDGSLDGSFSPVFNGPVKVLAVQPAGGLLVAGGFTQVNGTARAGLVRMDGSGAVIADWAPAVVGEVSTLVPLSDGGVIVAGDFTKINGVNQPRLARLAADGSLDATFAPTVDGPVHAVVMHADGTLELGGDFATVNGVARQRRATLAADGSLVGTAPGVTNGPVLALALDRSGRVIAGGGFSVYENTARYLVTRASASGTGEQRVVVDNDGRGLTVRRRGSLAAFSSVEIAVSTDGVAWAERGLAEPVAGTADWRWTGMALPIDSEYLVRVRGVVPGSRWASSGVSESRSHFLGTSPSGYGYATTLPFGDGLDNDSGSGGNGGSGGGSGGSGGGSGGGNEVDVLGSRFLNISTRVGLTGVQSLTLGFVLEGDTSRQMLLRAVGPSLANYGASGTMQFPRLTLYNATGQVVMANTGWAGNPALVNLSAQAGAFALQSGNPDAAIAPVLAPGLYSLVVDSRTGGGGVVLSEVYDVGSVAVPGRVVNLSARARTGTGDGVFITGFVIGGTEPREVLIRGVGPGLAEHDVADVLPDALLRLYNKAGDIVAENDNWQTPVGDAASGAAIAAAALQTGAFVLPEGGLDAAILVSLPPGLYTAVLSGVGDTVGEGLIEVYEVRD